MGQIIYEMSGLPGSGKSTFVNNICNSVDWLTKEQQFYYDTYHVRWGNFRTFLYILKGLDSICDITFIIKVLCDRDVTNRGMALKRIVKLFKLKGKIKSNNRYYLISEGLVQCFCEILDNVALEAMPHEQYIWEYFEKTIQRYNNVFFILLLCDAELCNNRIRNRTNVNNTIDTMKDEQRIPFLFHRKASEEYFFDIIKRTVENDRYLIINSVDNIETNSILIKNFITPSK